MILITKTRILKMEMYYKKTKVADMDLLMSDMNLGIYEFTCILDGYYGEKNTLSKINKWLGGSINYESLLIKENELYFIKRGQKYICDFTVFRVEKHNSKYITGGVDKIIANVVGLSGL